MAGERVRVLGPVEVVNTVGSVALAAKHRRLLAALLAADGRACTVDELVDGVWGERPPASARKLLQVYVSQLRKLLPEEVALVTRPGAYALTVEDGAVDADRFERLLREAEAAARDANHPLTSSLAQQALALWRGRAYGELAYDDAVHADAERLDELRLRALELRLKSDLELGRSDVLPELAALVGDYPLRERLHELLALALYRNGRQTEALEQLAALRTRLRDELGLEPSVELRELQTMILRQDPALAAAPPDATGPAALPAALDSLVGRGRELEQLVLLLSRRDTRLLVLTGAGGSGKTRLAFEAAREVASSYANGAAIVELAPLRDPALVAPAIAAAVDVAESPDEPLAETLGRALAGRELLLVLDNAEHLRAAAPFYVELLRRAPRLSLLVTSRAVLHLSGEHVFAVAPLSEDDAVELFTQRAKALQPSFRRAHENEDDLREICRRLDGLPLAIELAAGRIRTLPPRALRERLDERLRLLTAGPRDLPARQQTLRETIDWSVQLLSDAERRVFGRLAAFPGGATLAAAETVCGADVDALATLVDLHLVRREDGVEPRFNLLETIREYALELLGAELPAVELALAEELASLVDQATLKGPGTELWLPRLDAEIDNLRTALAAAAAAGNGDLELRLAGGLWRYWWIRGQLVEGRDRLEGALLRADDSPSVARARALAGAGGLAYSQGDLEAAKRFAGEALVCARQSGATYDESSARVVLGVVANVERDWEAARHHLECSIELSRQLGIDPQTEMLNLGITALGSGDFESAIAIFDELEATHRRNGTEEGVGFALLNRGLARHRAGDHDAAARDFGEAGRSFERLGFRAHAAHAVLGLAATEAGGGRFEAAARLLGESATELAEVGWTADDFDADLAGEVERAVRAALGDEAFAAAFDNGRRCGGRSARS